MTKIIIIINLIEISDSITYNKIGELKIQELGLTTQWLTFPLLYTNIP